jgi:serine/threonine-protein kinase
LKPGNIIFRRSGNPSDAANAIGRFVLVDFGIAAQLDAEGTQRNETWNGAGTAEYIAPEMLRRNPVATPQCDIYGFGTILYLLLTGRVPFPQLENSRLGLANCLKAVAHDPPPPFASVAQGLNYPPALEELILQCLEKDPARRPSSISEVCERFLANYSSESESGNFSQTLRPGGLMNTSRRRLRKSWRRTSSIPQARKRSPIPLLAVVLCMAAMVAFWIRSAGQTRHEDQPPQSETTPAASLAAIQPRSTFTMIAGEKEQPLDMNSPLQIPAGGMVELKFRVENVPPDHALEFSTPTATSAVKVEMRSGGDGASQVYSLVIPDRATPAGPLPPITFAARVAGVAAPVEATLAAEVLPPPPRLLLEGTLEPPDALLTVDGAPVEIHAGRWTWNEPEKEQVTLRAVREGFGDWEQTRIRHLFPSFSNRFQPCVLRARLNRRTRL